MSSGRNASPLGATGDMDLPAPVYAQLQAGYVAMDWLAHMILAVKTVAAGAEFIPLPYIRAAFGTVVIFLETVDKMKKNRDDLRELCEGTVEIVILLRDELAAHGPVIGARFMGLCENFMSFLRLVQTGLENLMRNRAGLRGRFKEFLRATTVADQIDRYRIRVNELRSNFILAATIQTNLNVASIQRSASATQEIGPIAHQFSRVALGDINLLYETAMSSKAHKIKFFTARISGEPSLMTVAKYEDDNEADLEQHSRWRHPHVLQLFGISSMPGIHALIYYDELVPLWIYRKNHRPSSDLVWSCIEGMLFKQFKECSNYHYWSTGDNKEKILLPPGSFKASEKSENSEKCPYLEFSIELEDLDEDLVSTSWLSQANFCISGTIFKDKKRYLYATIDTLRCQIVMDTSSRHQLRPEGTLREAHLFPYPIDIRHRGARIGLEFPHADHWYWSLDPSGITRMTLDESDFIGLPRCKFHFLPTINAWREYHYNAIREFSEARGCNPYSNDVARPLGLPSAEMESNYLTNATCEASPELRKNGG
ncbi:hypothetical protein B0H13DRAFT_2365813 [Mycena leptocephala]|nr:hypothetical protein B0H13DRAFT_2365813 [Mycena leptocephala]